MRKLQGSGSALFQRHWLGSSMEDGSMLKIVARKQIEACVSYFLKDKELDANERQGTWMGRCAGLLGLNPSPSEDYSASKPVPVNEDTLRTVLRGYAPEGVPEAGRRLNGRYYREGKRRCAYDCVLSSHKSISIAALCLPDEHLDRSMAVRTAWVRAVRDCLNFMESLARRSNGKNGDIETRSLLAAGFTHFVSRRNDPQLHTHLLVANTTYDDRNQARRRWYGLEPLHLFRQARQIDQVFQRELHRHLRSMDLHATMRKVGKVVVTTLPVPKEICTRLSKAHGAILAATASQWDREHRTRANCRAETFINERLRPSKAGLLAARDQVLGNALSPGETKEIVRAIGQPLPAEQRRLIVPPAPPSRQQLDQLILGTARQLNVTIPTTSQRSRVALYAADQYRDVPFQPFFDHVRERLVALQIPPHGPKYIAMHLESADKMWHGQEDWFGLKNSSRFTFTPHRPTDPPSEPNALLPLSSKEPEPLSLVPESQRPSWAAELLEARQEVREQIGREQRKRMAALAAEAAVLEETARRVRSSTSPPVLPPDPPGPPSSSPAKHGATVPPTDQQTRRGGRPGFTPSPSTTTTPVEPPLPSQPSTPEPALSPSADQIEGDAQPYWPTLQAQEQRLPGP